MARDRILLTPGPLTTTLRTKLAMLRDWGSWDAEFNRLTATIRKELLAIVHGEDSHVAVPRITHVGLIHCETGTGIVNPLADIAHVCARHGKGLIVDAMSAYGALPIDARRVRFDALVAASGKCLEGPPGMGFVLIRQGALERCAGNSQSLAMDLHDQH